MKIDGETPLQGPVIGQNIFTVNFLINSSVSLSVFLLSSLRKKNPKRVILPPVMMMSCLPAVVLACFHSILLQVISIVARYILFIASFTLFWCTNYRLKRNISFIGLFDTLHYDFHKLSLHRLSKLLVGLLKKTPLYTYLELENVLEQHMDTL